MRTKKQYEKMLSENPNTTIGVTLGADMVYAARHDVIHRAEAHGMDEWRTIVRDLKSTYGECLSVDEVRTEMGAPVKHPFTVVLDAADYERLSALAKRDGYKTAQLARLIIERAVRRKDVKK